MPVKLTLEQVLEYFRLKHGDRYDYSKFIYINNHTEGIIICREHGEFIQIPRNHWQGFGCSRCSGLVKLTLDEVIADFRTEHGDKYDYCEFVVSGNNKAKSTIICPTHGRFQQNSNNHKNGQGCPRCKESKGERKVAAILDSLNIIYERQKTFSDCKYKRCLPFDFYLPDYNLLIEFDGPQHFSPCYPRNDSEKAAKLFDLTVFRDSIKNTYCITHNIKLLRIPYTEEKNSQSLIISSMTP